MYGRGTPVASTRAAARITVLVCTDLGDRSLLVAVAAAARAASPTARIFVVDELCRRPRRLRAAAADLHPDRTVVACRRAHRSAGDIRLALDRAGVRPADVVIADLPSGRHDRDPPGTTSEQIPAAVRAAVVRASSIEPPPAAPGPPRCRGCGAPLAAGIVGGGDRGTGAPVHLAAIAARLAASHPAAVDRLLRVDRCADCLLTERPANWADPAQGPTKASAGGAASEASRPRKSGSYRRVGAKHLT